MDDQGNRVLRPLPPPQQARGLLPLDNGAMMRGHPGQSMPVSSTYRVVLSMRSFQIVMSPTVVSLSFGAILLLAAPFTAAEDWPGYRGGDRTNRSSEQGLFDFDRGASPQLLWTAQGLGSGYASVSVVADRIYTTGNFDDGQSVVAIDSRGGNVVWRTAVTGEPPKHGYDGSRSTPTVDEDRLYLVSSDGQIICLNAVDGVKIWSRDFDEWGGKMMSGWGYSESPLVDGDHVICTPGGREGMMVCLNKLSGETIWASVLPAQADGDQELKDGAGYASAVISNGGGVKQYVQLVGQGLIGVRASDGVLMWRYARVGNKTANIPTAVVDGDYVFTSTAYGTGSALLKLTGDGDGGVDVQEVYWLESRELQNKHGGMTLVEGHIYCGHGNGDGKPICVNMMTGEVAWGPQRAAGKGETSLVYADGHLVWRREDGTVIITTASPESFEVIGTFTPAFQQGKSWAHPVISGGRLYLREQDKLMCYRLGAA